MTKLKAPSIENTSLETVIVFKLGFDDIILAIVCVDELTIDIVAECL